MERQPRAGMTIAFATRAITQRARHLTEWPSPFHPIVTFD
jgi:hypothetical protein